MAIGYIHDLAKEVGHVFPDMGWINQREWEGNEASRRMRRKMVEVRVEMEEELSSWLSWCEKSLTEAGDRTFVSEIEEVQAGRLSNSFRPV
jgi:hypothetical protein